MPAEMFAQYDLLTEEQLETLKEGISEWVTCDEPDTENHLANWLENQDRAFKVEYSTETVDFAENDIDMEYEQLMELEAKQGPRADGGVLRGTYIDLDSSYEVYSLASTLFMRECCKSL